MRRGRNGGDPQADGPAQVVRGSGARAGDFLLRPGGVIPACKPAATVWAIMCALAVVLPGAGGNARAARGVAVFAFPAEGVDGPVEPVPGGASDHGAFQRPAGGAHGE